MSDKDVQTDEDQYPEEKEILEKIKEEAGGEPETFEIKDEEKEETEDPKVEEEVDSVQQRFDELGLERQFPGGVIDMMNRLPHMNKWQTQISQENAELKRKMEEAAKKEKEYDPDDFYKNPDEYLGDRYVTKDALEQVRRQMSTVQDQLVVERFNKFRETHEDFDRLEPIMTQIAQDDPGYLSLKDPLGALYKEAKGRTANVTSSAVKATQKKINEETAEQKKRASTEGSGTKPKSRKVTKDDLYNMPIAELEAGLGFDEKD